MLSKNTRFLWSFNFYLIYLFFLNYNILTLHITSNRGVWENLWQVAGKVEQNKEDLGKNQESFLPFLFVRILLSLMTFTLPTAYEDPSLLIKQLKRSSSLTNLTVSYTGYGRNFYHPLSVSLVKFSWRTLRTNPLQPSTLNERPVVCWFQNPTHHQIWKSGKPFGYRDQISYLKHIWSVHSSVP